MDRNTSFSFFSLTHIRSRRPLSIGNGRAVMDAATVTSRTEPDGSSGLSQRRTAQSSDAAPPHSKDAHLQRPHPPLPDDATIQQLRKAFQRKYRHVAAMHAQSQPSCLSHDAAKSPSFLGFRNLMVIVLVAMNVRLMIENIQKYGVLICIRCHDFRKHDVFIGLLLFLLIPCHLLAAFLIELAAARQAQVWRQRQDKLRALSSTTGKTDKTDGTSSPTEDDVRRFRITWYIVAWLHLANVTLALAAASLVVYHHVHHPLIGTLAEVHAIIVWLKTASYAFTNRDLRHAYLHPARGEREALPAIYAECPYPQNITMGNLVYFWLAPTLIYQPAYPRTPHIRWVFVAKRLAEAFVLSVFIWFCSAQYAAPVLQNSLDKIASLDLPAILERLLKLSTISLVIWLAGFFALFQSFLNAQAELTRFGDRDFYGDWWNSDSLGGYWRSWNKPVYFFFRRHVYSPLVGRGWSPGAASAIVFFVSALLHELLVGVPTHNIIGVAFLGMFLQLPLIALSAPLEKMHTATGRMLGNCIFWVSFTVLGQPFAALMYFYAWQAKYGSVSRMR